MKSLILSVEDNADDVLILRTAFRKAKISAQFDFLTDGQQAIDYFSVSSNQPLPTLLLLDLKLPKKSGLEVLAWVRNQPPLKRLPMIMLTSSSQPDDIDQAYNLGANSYLIKPGSIDELIQLAVAIESYWLKTNARPGVDSLHSKAFAASSTHAERRL